MIAPSPAVVVPMRRTLRIGGLAFLVIPVAAVIAFAMGKSAVAWGIALAGGLAWLFFGVTVLVALRTAATSPEKLGAIVLGTWLGKFVVLLGLLFWLQNQTFFDRMTFFVVVLVSTFALLIMEARITVTSRVPYVDPQ